MRQPLPLRRAWVAPLVVAALALAFGQGSAKAANPAAHTFTASETISFSAHLEMTRTPPPPPLPQDCPSQAVDTMNSICEHFTAVVSAANGGTLTFCITYPTGISGLNEVDLHLYDSAGTELTASVTDAQPNCVMWTTTTTGSFELRMDPSFLDGPIDFSGTVQFNAAGTGGGGTTGTGAGGPLDPPVSISDASVVAPDSGTATMVFSVSLDWPSLSPIAVDYATDDNTATVAGGDYLPQTGEVVFAPGSTTAYISVPVLPDLTLDPNENFVVNLRLPAPPYIATLKDGQGVGTILHEHGVDRISGGGSVVLGQGTFALRLLENRNGNVRWANGSDRFRSGSISSVTFTDATCNVHVEGTGVHNGVPVTFTADVQDNGSSGLTDTVALTLSDGKSLSGTLATGNITYTNR